MWLKMHSWVIMCVLGYRHKFLRFKITYNTIKTVLYKITFICCLMMCFMCLVLVTL